MGQNNCTPNIPGLENCMGKQYQIDENKVPAIINKQPYNMYTSMNESDRQFQNQKHQELYLIQQEQLKNYLQNSKMQNLSNSVRRNIEFQNRFLKLPSQLISYILYFVIDNYVNLLLVNTLWYTRLNEAISKTLNSIETNFSRTYPFLKVKQCKFSFKRFIIDKQTNGFRLDRNLIAEVLPGYENHLVKIGFSYKIKGNPNTVWYKFAIYKRNSKKCIWVGIDQSTNIYDKSITPIIQSVLPFCVGDLVKLPINILNRKGLMDVKELIWMSPIIEKFEVGIFDNPKHDFMMPPPRLEPIDADWQLYHYFQHPMKRCFDGLTQLKLKECRCSGTTLIVNKMTYVCTMEGVVEKAEQLFNLRVVVKRNQVENELKRAALTYDLDNALEVKVGDEITLYYLRGGDN